MKTLKSKKGFAFPTVLGTFVLVTGLVAGLFIMVMNMSMMVSSDSESSEEMFHARNSVDVFLDSVRTHKIIDHELRITLGLGWEHDEAANRARVFFTTSNGHEVSSYILFGTAAGVSLEDEMNQIQNRTNPPAGTNTFSFDEDTVITGNWTINSSNNGSIVVAEGKTLYIDGDFLVNNTSGNFDIIGNVVIVGSASLDNFHSGDITVNGNLIVQDDLSFINRHQGDIEINGDTVVYGFTTIDSFHQGDIQLNGSLTVYNELNIINRHLGDIEIEGDLFVFGNTTLDNFNQGDTIFGKDLTVNGNLIIINRHQGDTIVEGNTVIFGSLYIDLFHQGDIILDGDLIVDGDLEIINRHQGDILIKGDAIVFQSVMMDLFSEGDIIFDGNLDAYSNIVAINRHRGHIEVKGSTFALTGTISTTRFSSGRIVLNATNSSDVSFVLPVIEDVIDSENPSESENIIQIIR